MKIAITREGHTIEATPAAPPSALCPSCGGKLTLRSRRKMGNGGATYFWRHSSNLNRYCSARTRPIEA